MKKRLTQKERKGNCNRGTLDGPEYTQTYELNKGEQMNAKGLHFSNVAIIGMMLCRNEHSKKSGNFYGIQKIKTEINSYSEISD